MEIGLLLNHYGLWAVLLGSLLEGETVLALAGFAAHRGYLDFSAVVSMAWLGAVLGDQFYFWLGRRHGQTLLARHFHRTEKIRAAFRLIERHPVKTTFLMRFAWGLRTALPMAIGMSGVPSARFLLLNMASATLWAPSVAGAGWLFGEILARHIEDIQRIEHWALLVLAITGVLFHLFQRWRRRQRACRKRAGA